VGLMGLTCTALPGVSSEPREDPGVALLLRAEGGAGAAKSHDPLPPPPPPPPPPGVVRSVHGEAPARAVV